MISERKIQGIIFDKDGTLFNYSDIWSPVFEEIYKSMFEKLKIKYTEKNIIRIGEIVGLDGKGNVYQDGILFKHTRLVRVSFKLFFFGLRNRINPFNFLKYFLKNFDRESKPLVEAELDNRDFSHVQNLFKKLSDNNIPIGIVTQDNDENSNIFLDKMGISQYVSFLKTKTNTEKRKPHPDTFFEFLDKFNLKAQNVAFVGDTLTDMKYAKRAKSGYVVALLSGPAEVIKLTHRSDAIYPSISDLINDPILFPKAK